MATFNPDGTCEMSNGVRGAWHFLHNPEAARKYAINWEHGRFQDKLSVSPDGQSALLTGTSKEHYDVRRATD